MNHIDIANEVRCRLASPGPQLITCDNVFKGHGKLHDTTNPADVAWCLRAMDDVEVITEGHNHTYSFWVIKKKETAV